MNTRERKTIAQWRKAKFLTQEELGKKIDVSPYTISSWEVGSKQDRKSVV